MSTHNPYVEQDTLIWVKVGHLGVGTHLFENEVEEALIPHAVVRIQVANNCTLMEAWRKYLGMSQAEIADKLGTSQPNYAKIEKSDNPRRDTIARIAAAMGIDTAQLSE